MAFNPTNPVSVGLATKVDHYDRVFNNTLLLKTSIEDDGSLIAGLLLRTPTLRGYRETAVAASISAGTLTIDLTLGNLFYVTLNANVTTFAISNVPASGLGAAFRVIFIADGTLRTITWGPGIRFANNNSTPTMTSTSGRIDEISFEAIVGTTLWRAAVVGQNWPNV